MRIRDTVVTAAGTAALITMLAGCGSAAPAPPSAAESASMPSAGSLTPSASPTRTAGRLTSLDGSDSPLQAFLWEGAEAPPAHVADPDADARAKAEWDEWERRIGECMKAKGFDYEPRRWQNTQTGDHVGELSDTREFVEQCGFGIADSPTHEQPAADDSPIAYVDTLSESARLEYEVALSGEWFRQAQVDHDTEVPTAWQDLGCNGKATHEMESEVAKPSSWEALAAEYGDLESAMYDELPQKSAASPEMTALTEKWTACMAKGGHPYASPSDMITKLYDEYATFSVPDPERPAYTVTDTSVPGYDAFVDKEMETAAIDYDCRNALDYEDEALRIGFAYEEKFIDDHRAELEKYRTALQLALLGDGA